MENAPIRRRGLARVLVVLATIVALFAIVSVWVNRQMLNTDNWTETSSSLLENKTIREGVSTYLVDQLYLNVDVAGQIREALPPRAQPLAGPAAGALRNFAERAANEALQRPRAQQAWESANRAAHELFLKTLEGGGPIVGTEGGVVVLDLKALLTQTQERVGLGGRVVGKLPDSAASITILESDQLDSAQAAFRALRRLPVILVGLSLLLFGAALWASPGWRRNAVRAYGIGFLVVGVLALLAVSQAGDYVTTSLARTKAGEPLVLETWVLSTTLLREVAMATIFYGLLMFFGALLAGPSAVATSIRRTLAPYLREPAWAYGAIAVVLALVFFWWTPTPAMRNPVTGTLLLLLILAGFEALRRRTAAEFPEADGREAAARVRERVVSAAKSTPGRFSRTPEPTDARLGDLERLKRLHVAGGVSDKEYAAEKARILGGVNGGATEVPPPVAG